MRGEEECPRHLYELEAANDNLHAPKILADQKAKDAALARRERHMIEGHQKAWQSLRDTHQKRSMQIAANRRKQAA